MSALSKCSARDSFLTSSELKQFLERGETISFIAASAPQQFHFSSSQLLFLHIVCYIFTQMSPKLYPEVLQNKYMYNTRTLCRQRCTPSWFCVFWLRLLCIQQAVQPGPEVQCIFPVMWSITTPQRSARLIGLDGRGKQL